MGKPQHDAVLDALRRVIGGQDWLVAFDVVQGTLRMAGQLRELGAARCFALAARMGTGAIVDEAVVDWTCLMRPPARSMMDAIRDAEAALRDLPPDVQQAVDRFDPERRARVIGAFFSTATPVAGRAYFGARPAAWQALEDKVVVDGLWDRAGVPRARAEVVPASAAPLAAASSRCDGGAGVVWAGDAREGFHGGATHTWWIRDPADRAAALAFLQPRCDRVRVMPFLDGIPCSIHGIVFDEHVVVLRPAEMVVLRQAAGNGFRYARAATFWDPPEGDRDAMRSAARQVGALLREELDYRGAFTIDGVMTVQGFRPTELNPRPGAALGLIAPTFPFSLLSFALVERAITGVDPVALEAELLAEADAHRAGSLSLIDEAPPPADPAPRPLAWRDGAWHDADADGAHATLIAGPGPTGVYLSLRLDPAHTPVGPSVGPRAAALARYADAHLGTTFGALEHAPELRT